MTVKAPLKVTKLPLSRLITQHGEARHVAAIGTEAIREMLRGDSTAAADCSRSRESAERASGAISECLPGWVAGEHGRCHRPSVA